jgi:hypothetical protein
MEDTPEAPLWARMTESMPGISTSIAFGIHRGSSTIMRGGFMDPDGTSKMTRGLNRVTGNNARRARNFRIMQDGKMTGRSASQFAGSRGIFGGRAARLASDSSKSPFLKSARVNNITMRPRAFGRFHSLSIYGGTGAYTPFQSSGILGKTPIGKNIAKAAGIEGAAVKDSFGPGLLSFMSAGRKADRLERRVTNRLEKGKSGGRSFRRLERLDNNIKSLAGMNNSMLASELSGKAVTGGVGTRGNLLASSMRGEASQFMAGYARGAAGFAGEAGLYGKASAGATRAVEHMTAALGESGIMGRSGTVLKGTEGAEAILKRGAFKELGAKGIVEAMSSKAGAKALSIRAATLAIPGLQVVGAVMLARDLGKMAGNLVTGGINLAKDAVKSMKGDIKKPVFGSVYKDTEAAATSRSRGVMAIQNSQLNARSALGNEGALMAAHFG